MRVVILGSGVVGVTSAWYLARAGHEVTVLDRQPARRAGDKLRQCGPGLARLFRPLGRAGHSGEGAEVADDAAPAAGLLPQANGGLYPWLARMLANCTEEAYATNKARMVRLAEYSRDCLRDLRDETGIAYDAAHPGHLAALPDAEAARCRGRRHRGAGHLQGPYELLDPAGCIGAEPALALVPGKYVGGLRLPGDETGDAHVFTQRLAALAAEAGVAFRHGVTIQRLETEGDRISGVVTDQGRVTADAYVVAMGSYSTALLRPLGVAVPVYPVKGYSLTLPITDEAAAPVSTVMDETFKVAITRLGDRIRVGGTAELAGFSLKLRKPRRETLAHSVGDLFPKGGTSPRPASGRACGR